MASEGLADGAVAARPTVSVVGQAAIATEPDEAFVWITLSAIEELPGPALTDVAGRSQALAVILDELQISRERRSTTGITVNEEFDHSGRVRRSLGYRATMSNSVCLSDSDLIGRLLMRTSEELDAQVAGPTWRVSSTNPAWLLVATKAAANARAKAAAYATGVDASLGALIALSESDHVHRGGVLIPRSARAATAGPDLHVDAGEQEVIASIQATFALELK
jgi:uncharacterized protein